LRRHGAFVYVARDTLRIAEMLRTKSREDLLTPCAQVGVTKNATEPPEALVSFLVSPSKLALSH